MSDAALGKQPFFSVVIPLYNRAEIVGDTIRSVLAQDWRDFEIVVIDAGSRDNPGPVIAALGAPRVRYTRPDHAGRRAARRPAERRLGEESVRTCRSPWSPPP